MTYAEQVAAVSAEATKRALSILDLLVAGQVTVDEAVDLLAATIGGANAKAQALAALSVAATITTATGTPVVPVAVPVPPADRLLTAARTILAQQPPEADVDPRVAQLERLADNEPHRAGAQAFTAAMTATPQVGGYRRGVEPAACVMCAVWHERGGYVWPASKPFWRHTGCRCWPIPTTDQPVGAPKRKKRKK